MDKRFYIGTYTGNSDSAGLYYLRVDFDRREVETIQTVAMKSPSLVAYSPDHTRLYAVQEFDTDRSMTAFSVAEDGKLTILNTATVPTIDICHVQVAPDSSFLIGSSYGAGFVVTLKLNEDGSLGEMVQLDQHTGHGPCPEQNIPRAHCCVFDRTGKYIVSADYGNDTLYVYRHHDGGRLERLHRYSVPAGYAPRIVTFSLDNHHLYVVHQNGNQVTHYTFDEQDGALREKESLTCLPEGFTAKSEGAEVQLSPDGRFLYASSRGADTLAAYAVEQDGAIRLLGVQCCGGSFPRHFTITRDGRYLLCGNQNSDTVTVFERDNDTGLLSEEPIFTFPLPCPTFVLEARR